MPVTSNTPEAPEQTSGATDPKTGAEEPKTGTEGGDSGTQTTDVAVLQRDLDHALAQAQQFRAELKALREAKRAEADAAKTEAQRITEMESENALLKAALAASRLEAAVAVHAGRLNIIDAEAAVKLLDRSKLELDEEGNPKNVEAALRDLIAERPYLAPKAPTNVAPSGGTNAASGTAPGPAPRLTAEELAAAKLTGTDPARYAAMKNVKTLDDYMKVARPSK
jgi:hypothetical protein